MKQFYSLLTIFLLFNFSFSLVNAQEVDSKKVDDLKSSIENGINSPQAVNDKVTFKDGPTTLLEINSEGSAGSIILPSVGSILSGNKLYNNGNILYWGNIALGSGGASEIDDLSDAKFDGSSLFLGEGSGTNDNETTNFNVGVGYQSLYSNTAGTANTANGYQSLYSNISGAANTANGYRALYLNTYGFENTSHGYAALYSNTTGTQNTASGVQALYSNTTGIQNTANGYFSLFTNTEGFANTANGYFSLHFNTLGFSNTANGYYSLYLNTTGNFNTASGTYALYHNTTGENNTAIGYDSGPNSVALNNTTALGSGAITTESNQVVLGNASVTKIGGYAPYVQLSDGRYKRNIKDNVSGLEFIMGLRPITYNFDVNAIAEKLGEDIKIDEKGNRSKVVPQAHIIEARENKSNMRESGFIAQEVEELVNKLGFEFGAVKAPENEESMYSMNYSEFVVPLVKAVQEQQTMIDELKKEIQELKSRK